MFGISGFARSGKDTFAKHLKDFLNLEKINCEITSLAFPLKKSIDPFLLKEFKISAFTANDEEKNIIRPLLVAFGESKRNIDGDFWIKQLNDSRNKNKLLIVPDVRYINEASWIVNNNGFLLGLNRMKPDGSYIEAPNEQEKITIPETKKLSHFELCWQTIEDEKTLKQIVGNFADSVLEEHIKKWKVTFPL